MSVEKQSIVDCAVASTLTPSPVSVPTFAGARNRGNLLLERLAEWFDSPVAGNRLLPMEGLRGLAVLLVFFVHYYWLFLPFIAQSPVTSRIGLFAATLGHSGVDLFFVMSGYLIYAAALKPQLDFSRFLLRRIQRIYPAFLAVLAVYIVISYVTPDRSRIPEEPVNAVVYILQNIALLPGIFAITPIITVAWSLSYEFLYYLMAPSLTRITGMSAWPSGRRIALILAVSGTYLVMCALGWTPHVRMVVFAAGMILYEIVNGNRARRLLSAGGELAAIAGFSLALVVSTFLLEPSLLLTKPQNANVLGAIRVLILSISFLVFALFCFQFNGILHRVFSWKPLRYWGNMSYSYYLWHGLLLHSFKLMLLRPIESVGLYWALLPVSLSFTIAGSAVMYLLIEKPFSLKPAQSLVNGSGNGSRRR